MTYEQALAVLVLGVGVGTLSGMVGIGGGVLVIPLLMLFFSFSQKEATGTSLAMLLPPIGVFAVLAYAREGSIDWRFAGLLALGFTFGGYLGARLVIKDIINPTALRVLLALFLIYVAVNMLFRPGGRVRTTLESILAVAGFAVVYMVLRLLGRKRMPTPHEGPRPRRRLRHAEIVDYEI